MSSGERFRGDGRVFLRGRTFWIAYVGPDPSKGGEWGEIRESAKTTDEKVAGRLLRDRLDEVRTEALGGPKVVAHRRVTVNEILDGREAVVMTKSAYARTSKSAAKNVRRLIGSQNAKTVTPKTVIEYAKTRLAEGAAKATVDKETAILRQAFGFGIGERLVSDIPKTKRLLVQHENARTEWIDLPKFRELIAEIRKTDEDFADWIEWFGWCGMRDREISTLAWEDLQHGEEYDSIVVRVENAKVRTARKMPLVGPLAAIIARRQDRRRMDCRLVFHSNGRTFENKVGGLPGWALTIWHRACERVGLEMLPAADPKRKSRRVSKFRPYDLRRLAAYNLKAAGVPMAVAIAILGQKTMSMHLRYTQLGNVDELADGMNAVGEWEQQQTGKRSKLAVGKFGKQ